MNVATADSCNKKHSINEMLDLTENSCLQESSGEEKCDINPEHSKKSDTSPDEESISDSLDCNRKAAGGENSETCDSQMTNKPLDVYRSLAFTIGFDEDKVINSKKYNDIVERFQKRHRRGVSLSKLDDKNAPPPQSQQQLQSNFVPNAIAKSKPPTAKKLNQRNTDLDIYNSSVDSQVRLRDKSQLHATSKEQNQRHSWSPKTCLNTTKTDEQQSSTPIHSNFKPKSTILQKAMEDIQRNHKILPEKSIELPIFKDNVEMILCSKPPLAFSKNSDEDSVSDAGTYTLDGDNYTEEQKAKMSIDKIGKESSNVIEQQEKLFIVAAAKPETKNLNICDIRQSNMEGDLKIIELDPTPSVIERRRKNILEVTYTQQDMQFEKPKTSYLEKIKSKVKHIGDRAFQKSRSPDKSQIATPPTSLDIGSFTSVTASGAFSRPPKNLPAKITCIRRNSLTQSQIDSSEYVQRSGVVNKKLFNSYTDYEKARHNEYKLNIFSYPGCYTDAEKENANERLAAGLENAETKNDWIQEWAKNARRNTTEHKLSNPPIETNYDTKLYSDQFGDNLDRNYSSKKINRYRDIDYEYRPKSVGPGVVPSSKHSPTIVKNHYETNYRSVLNEFGVGSDFESDEFSSPSERTHDSGHFLYDGNVPIIKTKTSTRPPISPTKIPSPLHTLHRGRSSSVTKDMQSSNTDLDDTEMYLQKTAAAISTLQNIQQKNLPQNPLVPEKMITQLTSSPTIRRHHNKPIKTTNYVGSDQNAYTSIRLKQLHKRNNSLDGIEFKSKIFNNREMSHSYDSEQMNVILNSKQHTRHNSYEDKTSTSQLQRLAVRTIDQTFSPQILMRSCVSTKYHNSNSKIKVQSVATPMMVQGQIKRSSSFSAKQLANQQQGRTLTPKFASKNIMGNTTPGGIQKSASSTSFKNIASHYDNAEFYLNDEDDLDPNICSSESEFSETENEKEPIRNTRYNKAFLIRMEQNKQKATVIQKQPGAIACPNTPEQPRRENRIRSSLRDRASMPRDSSLNRMKQDIPSLNISKKVLTAKEKDSNKKVVPKYLDISKYKQGQSNTFLKRDESKSTLINKDIKRSTSAFVGLNKSDVGRSSIRSVKSAGSGKSTAIAPNQNTSKEAELAMWRRRASYDPMKAAAEGKRKQEEARKAMQSSKYNESSVVLRSQSFHNGVGQTNLLRDDSSEDVKHRWTLISTESSDDEFKDNY